MDTRLLAFTAAAALVVAVPGPSVVFTVGRALAHGRRVALATVAGNALGIVVQVLAVAAGLGPLVAGSATAFTVLKLGGAAYLVWLGIHAIRHRHEAGAALAAAAGAGDRVGAVRALRDGAVVGLLNPKSVVFLVAFLPQFVDPAGGVAAQIVLLGAVFVLVALVLDSVWALGAGAARDRLARSPRRLAAVGAAGGVTMIGLGVGVAASRAA
ncbi:LysE family translocator [Pseudonocardia spirodelae]|uniref:LysE family translocator n=1 Tax=Pseudonocardia spirodelae TaxID=3133431 RepID=A0ABU8TF95_9PSEU